MVVLLAIVLSVVAISLSVYVLMSEKMDTSHFDHKAFVEDMNAQLHNMKKDLSHDIHTDLKDVRNDQILGFKAAMEADEHLSDHVNKNFQTVFSITNDLRVEISHLWKRLEKLGVKRHARRGRPRKGKEVMEKRLTNHKSKDV